MKNKSQKVIYVAAFLSVLFSMVAFFLVIYNSSNKSDFATAASATAILDSQADWQSGTSLNIDSTTTPGTLEIDNQSMAKIDLSSISTSATDDLLNVDHPKDNDELSYWTVSYPAGSDFDTWDVDFGSAVSIAKTRYLISAEHTSPMGCVFTLWYSNNGIDFTQYNASSICAGPTHSTKNWGEDNTAVTARYFRIRVNSMASYALDARIYEYELYTQGNTATHTSGLTQINGSADLTSWDSFTATEKDRDQDSGNAATKIEYQFRSGDGNATWDAWTAKQEYSGSSLSLAALNDDATHRYLQVLSTFTTTNSSYTPTLSDYTVNYTTTGICDNFDHVNISPTSDTIDSEGTTSVSATAVDASDNPIAGVGVSYSADCGSVDGSGNFTAPDVAVQTVCTITAVSDCGDSITSAITVNPIVLPSCDDGIQNQDETGVDCGGVCLACPVPPACDDGIENGDETGVDCGGSCSACPVPETCDDSIQNQDETGVDCGGVCLACPVPPSCDDGIQNGDETGVDCGGSCGACPVPPTCSDNLMNGSETGVDCGGSCSACPVPNVCQLDECSSQALSQFSSCQTEAAANGSDFDSCSNNYCQALRSCSNDCGGIDAISQTTALSQPNGGESYNIADTVNVRWRYALIGSQDTALINNLAAIMSVSLDGGENYTATKLLIPSSNTDSVAVRQARNAYSNLEVATYQFNTNTLNYYYPWIPGNPAYVSKHVKIRIEPLNYNCLVNASLDSSDNNFELWQNSPQLTLRVSPNSPRVAIGQDVEYTISAFLNNGQDVTVSTRFSYVSSKNAKIKSYSNNKVILTALENTGFFEQVLLVNGSYQNLTADSYGSIDIFTIASPPRKNDGCGFFCDIIGSVKSFIENFTAAQTRRNLLSLFAIIIALINLIANSISLSKSLIAPFVKGKDKRKTHSLVYDSLTGQPIPRARIMLINKGLGNVNGMTLSDKEGRYSIELNPGKDYRIKVEKDGYELFDSARTNIDKNGLPYSDNYFGEDFTAKKDQFVFNKNLPMLEIHPEIAAKKILRASRINAILIGINIPLVLIGSGLSLIILYQYPIFINYLVVCLYILSLLLYLIKNWGVEGKGSGVVINKSDSGKAVDLALVRAIRSQNNTLAHTVLSDHEGRYSLALPKGIYEVFAVKTGLSQVGEVTAVVRSAFRPREDTIHMTSIENEKSANTASASHEPNLNNYPLASSPDHTAAPSLEQRETNDPSEMIERYNQKSSKF